MAKMNPNKKDIPLSDIKSISSSTELYSSRMSGQSNNEGFIRNSAVQDFPMASLKSAAQNLKMSTRESLDTYQELEPMPRKNSEKR
jgi:hypothetical protein